MICYAYIRISTVSLVRFFEYTDDKCHQESSWKVQPRTIDKEVSQRIHKINKWYVKLYLVWLGIGGIPPTNKNSQNLVGRSPYKIIEK